MTKHSYVRQTMENVLAKSSLPHLKIQGEEEVRMDMDKPGDKAKVKAIVKQWMKTNVLKAAEMYDKRQGRDVQCVVVGEMIKWDEV